MNSSNTLMVALVAMLLLAGCAGSEKVISSSQQIITENEEGRSTIVDVKIDKYEKLARDFPKEPRYQERLARYYWEKRDHQSALAALKKARRIDPNNPRYDYLAAQIYKSLGSYTAAERSYLALIESTGDQKYSGPLIELAQLYVDMDRLDLARKYLDLCLEVDPTFGEPHYWIATIYLKQGRRDLAIRSYERYLRVGNSARQEEVLQTLQALQPDLRIHDIR
ncbi:MAG: hypothetical protein CBC13_11120 [Planctomycetia bacterium TMED53]|nr:MAG: hypothetical protein CBC13_11120 [Planctomycetia bacterium TMED53]